MATIPVMNFHNQKMEQERQRVMLRIMNGLKSDTSAVIARRMMNPSFKGLVKNSTGSRNMPFFAATNEINTPLEAKLAMRGVKYPSQYVPNRFVGQQRALPLETHVEETDQLDANPNIIAPPFESPLRGGVLKNYNYAKKILNQRKLDIENQLRAEMGEPGEAPPTVELNEVDSKKLELAQIMDFILSQIISGDYNVLNQLEMKNLIRLVISLGPIFTPDELADVVRVIGQMISTLEEASRGVAEGAADVEGNPAEARQYRNAGRSIILSTRIMEKILRYLKEMAKIVYSPIADKKLLAETLAKEMGGAVGYKALLKEIKDNAGLYEAMRGVAENEMTTDIYTEGPTSASHSSGTTTTGTVSQSDVTSEVQGESVAGVDMRRANLVQRVNDMYVRNDIAGLQQILRQVAPQRRADRFFGANASRTVLRNAIMREVGE